METAAGPRRLRSGRAGRDSSAVRSGLPEAAARIPRRSAALTTSPISRNSSGSSSRAAALTDPLSLEDYRRHGGLRGLERALALGSKATIEEVLASGLRGRGGAGFPTGIKWRTTAGRRGRSKVRRLQRRRGRQRHIRRPYADGGRPFLLIEGMAIAASRSARPRATSTSAPNIRTPSPRLSGRSSGRGRRVARPERAWSGKAFDLEARLGAGAYICGEETSLLESLEGKRGQIRAKPPLAAIRGCSASRRSSTMC